MRRFDVIDAWRPNQAQRIVAALPDLDLEPLLRLAIRYHENEASRKVLLALARAVEHRAFQEAARNISAVRDRMNESTVVFPATPIPAIETDVIDLDETVRRAGWLPILARTDDLAFAAVQQAFDWDGGHAFPFTASVVEIDDAHDPVHAEWTNRLESTRRTASFQVFGHTAAKTTLLDPVSGCPVIKTSENSYLAAVPQYVASTQPLSEVILAAGRRVWIRTSDNIVHIAPRMPNSGVAWGYRGSGSKTLAQLLHQLLDGRSTRAIESDNDMQEGLFAIVAHAWPEGTTLTRNQLERALRDGFAPLEN